MGEHKRKVAPTTNKLLLAIGNEQYVSFAIAFLVSGLFTGTLFVFGAFSKLPEETKPVWIVRAGMLIWFLSEGIVDVIGIGWATKKERLATCGTRAIGGALRALLALLIFLASALYVWLR